MRVIRGGVVVLGALALLVALAPGARAKGFRSLRHARHAPPSAPGADRTDAAKATPRPDPENPSIALTVGGRARRYVLHVPRGRGGPPAPLVLVLHDAQDTPESVMATSGFNALADENRFAVAYPESAGDLSVPVAVVNDVRARYLIDPARIYACGMGAGGALAAELACRSAGVFAAVGLVCAVPAGGRCAPALPVSMIGIQGADDPKVPFAGSRPLALAFALANGCADHAVEEALPATHDDGTSVTKRTYAGGRAGAELVWYEIKGGGHRWPPHQRGMIAESITRRMLGASSRNLDASATLWAFFAAHARRP